jgi:uncharacterized protein (TIGR04255 family)
MGWNVEQQKHRVFTRNPLVAVVVELRFHPVLKVPDLVANFQEQVRTTFPGYQDLTRQLVTLGPIAQVEVRDEKLFSFIKADETTNLSLTKTSLSVECRRHEHRDSFIADAKVGIDALSAVYGRIAPLRLGLRYIDVIDKAVVERDLDRPTTWSALITERFLNVPTGLADLDKTMFASEVASPMPSGGGMVVRHGLMQDVDGQTKFRLDVDRYQDRSIDVDSIVKLLGEFADDIFSVFNLIMGPDLKLWMPERNQS